MCILRHFRSLRASVRLQNLRSDPPGANAAGAGESLTGKEDQHE